MQERGWARPEGLPPDSPTENPPPGTGIEESVWQLSLEGRHSYPERPGERDCVYYMRTGFCGYGVRCRYNHPRDRCQAVGGGEYPERLGQPVCQYYMKTGACKYGATCKYHHPKQGEGTVAPVEYNYLGYPIRPGEKECSYYMKTGHCKFGVTCKFHHPQVSDAPTAAPASAIYPQMQSSVPLQYGGLTNWQLARPPLVPGSYFQGPYGTVMISPGMVPMPSLTAYPTPVSPVASPAAQNVSGSSFGLTHRLSLAPSSYQGQFGGEVPSSSNQRENVFPERPEEPVCQYYMRTGDCKYGSTCRYHHPRNLAMTSAIRTLSPIGLPVRPGAPRCMYYAQHGICKFGPTCKYDHPMETLSYTQPAPSHPFMPMPMSSYLVGSTQTSAIIPSLPSEPRPSGLQGDSPFVSGIIADNTARPVSESHELRSSVSSSKGATLQNALGENVEEGNAISGR